MKKSFLLLPLIAGLSYVTLSSNSGGFTSDNHSGSVTATAGCGGSGCHGTAAASSDTMRILVDSGSTGTYVTRYVAGKQYKITLIGVNASTTAILPKFGFQMTTVNAATTTTQAGSYGTAPTGSNITVVSAVSVFGHTMPWNATGGFGAHGGPGAVDSVSILWNAPTTAGSGAVKIFAAINMVDSDGAPSAGDKWNLKNVTLTELYKASVNDVRSNVSLKAYPNPVVSGLNIEMNNTENGTYNVSLFDLAGKLMNTQTVTVNGTSASVNVDMNSLTAGIYQVVVEKDGVFSTTSVAKN